MSATGWIIEPRDPFIARNGKPFGAIPGARSQSVSFPYPGTLAGGVRTAAGSDEQGVFNTRLTEEVRQIAVKGPLLARLTDAGEVSEWFAPVPADAVLLGGIAGRSISLKRLAPLSGSVDSEGVTNLPDGLRPIHMVNPEPEKPATGTPAFWYWNYVVKWLENPEEQSDVRLGDLGDNGPDMDSRTHVALDPATGTAREGALFQTRGLVFESKTRRLGLVVMSEADIRPGLRPLGGERRLVYWRKSTFSPPECPETIVRSITNAGRCRLLLLTPACFEKGYRPTRLLESQDGVSPVLEAALVHRPATVSGWDFARGNAKPTRRLAPAGSVYYLRLDGDRAAIEAWVRSIWMTEISDSEQDRRDGYGLAVLGTWND